MSAILSEGGSAVVVARRRRTDVTWGAITAGWLLSYGVAWLLYLLGSAVGLTAVGFTEENIAAGLAWSTVIWMIVTWAASMFVGGAFAGWLTGNLNPTVGAMHGIAVWALATLLGLVLAALTAVNVLQAGQSLLPGGGGMAEVMGGAQQSMGQGATGGSVTMALQAEIKQALSTGVAQSSQNAQGGQAVTQDEARRAIDQLRPATLATIAGQLARGDMAGTENTLVVNTPLTRAQANQVIQGMTSTAQKIQQRAKEAADKAAKYTAAALWALFASSAIGLVMAAWGGAAGGLQGRSRGRERLEA